MVTSANAPKGAPDFIGRLIIQEVDAMCAKYGHLPEFWAMLEADLDAHDPDWRKGQEELL